MPTYRATVGADRSLTLPAALCKQLKIKAGTSVEFFLTIDGQVHFHAITGTATGFGGIVSEVRSPPISVREMDDGIAEGIVEDHLRIERQYRRSGKKTPSAAE